MKNKAAIAGAIVIIIFAFVAIFAPLIAPHNPLKIYAGKGYLPPAWEDSGPTGKAGNPDFLLGTDSIGRDVFSRLIYGARVSMVVGLVPMLIILIVGVSVGCLRASGAAGSTTC